MAAERDSKENVEFKRLSVNISLLNGSVYLYGESTKPNEALYHTEIKGKIIHEFRDEHTLSKKYMFSYFATVIVYIKQELKNMNISSEGIGREAAWNISFTPIKED